MYKYALLSALAGLTSACSDSCVAEGSMVSTPQGPRPIESLRVGDAIESVDVESGERVAVTITAIRTATRECVGIELGGGERLVCTSNHPIFDPARREYRSAGDWVTQSGLSVLRAVDGRFEPVSPTATSAFAGLLRVFDLTVSGAHHNFVADGVVVHNKSILVDDEGDSESESTGAPYDESWFDEVDAIPCDDPLPEGAACLTIRGKQFYLASGAAVFVNNSVGDVAEFTFVGDPSVEFHFPQTYAGENACGGDSSFAVQFTGLFTLRETSCTWSLDATPLVQGGTASGSMTGELEVDAHGGTWEASMSWNAVPVAP